jgi:hypothetical protein
VIWPQTATPVSPEFQVLSKLLVARPLPMSADIASPDFVSGNWAGRLDDAGDCSLLFPNREASDGPPWRRRFDPSGHLQFVEIYRNSELESVCVIDTVSADGQQVSVHGQDGWFLLKKAYERDWVVVQSPRDVIERATQVWVPVVVDNFPAGALNARWTTNTGGGGTVATGTSGGLVLACSASDSAIATVDSPAITIPTTGSWSATCSFTYLYAARLGRLNFTLLESSGDWYSVRISNGAAHVTSSASAGVRLAQTTLAQSTTYALMLASDGEWVWAFANGQLVGTTRRISTATTSLSTEIQLLGTVTSVSSATVTGILVEALQPFLQRGTDQGDYVLPGTASTYPSGGLHGRYYNDTDLASDANRLLKILAPNRSQAYAGSGTSEYQNQQDATINGGIGQQNPQPGAATSNWSVKWFGAIYLKLSAGDYTFQLNCPVGNNAVRMWVGKTKFGDQLVDQWSWQSTQNWSFTVTAASLAGSLPYGGGTVSRDGWYPIKIEFAVDSTSALCPTFWLTNSPAAYTDPGGTAIASGAQSTVVPATSLSPLGCVDQRYQGVSHFDLAQQTVTGFGYQAAVEPQQLESGLFPGVLAPRVREGHDTDIILKPDLTPRDDGEGLLNYSSTLDATDFCSSLQGNGAGFQNGTTGQLQADVYDPPTLLASLFDAQGWQDFSDASFTALLQALLNAQLGLRLTPWQLLSADPTGSSRLAYTWPLPGALAAMRWRPGDGARVQAPNINVFDTVPRQLLVITRNITPNGKTGASASWANRPRNPARALKQLLYAATRMQRNYQKQLVTLSGNCVSGATVAPGNSSPATQLMVSPGDQVVRVRLRLTTVNGFHTNILVNAVDQTATLNGPWFATPVILDLTSVATPDSQMRIYAQASNQSGANETYNLQLFVDVLR